MRGLGVVVALLGLAVAGCNEPPSNGQPADDASPGQPHVTTDPFTATVIPGPETSCSQVLCTNDGENWLYTALANASIIAVEFTIGPTGHDGVVVWELECMAEEGCASASLASGRERLPVTVNLTGLALPRHAELHLDLRFAGMGPEEYVARTLVTGFSEVSGTISTVAVQMPPTERVPITVEYEGNTGPCVIVVEVTCTSSPGGSYHDFGGYRGVVVGFDITMTWDSTNPLEAELGFRVRCGVFFDGDCTDDALHEAYGTSPLRLNATGLRWEGAPIEILVQPSDPTGFGAFGARTPVHIVATFTDERPILEEDGSGDRMSRSG